jgi:hypothetical protein
MHPKIKEFWLKQPNHELIGPIAPGLMDIWEIYIGKGPSFIIETVCHGDKHRYNGQWYSEDEMLSLINLITFQ